MNKIYISEKNGSAYWLEGNVVMVAPMNLDNTIAFDEAGEVEVWADDEDDRDTEADVRAKLA